MIRYNQYPGQREPANARIVQSRGSDTLGSVLISQADRLGDRPFLLFERQPRVVETISWREQADRSRRTAAALRGLGVGTGDRIGVHLTNCPEFYDTWFGAALLGAVIVPTNPLSTADELRYVTEHAGCSLTVSQPEFLDTVTEAGAPRIVDVTSDWAAGQQPDDWSADDWSADVAPSTVSAVLYTSGTTSRPKGVLVTHGAYLNVGDAVANHLRMRPDDRQLIVLPLFHGNAQYYSTMSAFVTGASLALAPRFSASRWSEQASVLGATISSLFAAPMRMILAQPEDAADSAHSLRLVIYAQSLSAAQSKQFERRFAAPILQLYGMTETVVPPLINPLYEQRDPESIGRPIAGARLRVIDDHGADVPPGQPGELLVYCEPGVTAMVGYLDDAEATRQTLAGGWLHTGDVTVISHNGYFYFVDRAKDMIKRAGENVSCSEVEAVINSHPAVFESAVVGFRDDMRDESLRAFVVRNPGSDVESEDIFAYCVEKLSKFKVPASIAFVAELPRTSVGKIRKHLLRDQEYAEWRPSGTADKAQASGGSCDHCGGRLGGGCACR